MGLSSLLALAEGSASRNPRGPPEHQPCGDLVPRPQAVWHRHPASAVEQGAAGGHRWGHCTGRRPMHRACSFSPLWPTSIQSTTPRGKPTGGGAMVGNHPMVMALFAHSLSLSTAGFSKQQQWHSGPTRRAPWPGEPWGPQPPPAPSIHHSRHSIRPSVGHPQGGGCGSPFGWAGRQGGHAPLAGSTTTDSTVCWLPVVHQSTGPQVHLLRQPLSAPGNTEAQAARGVTPCWPVALRTVPLCGSQDSAYYQTYQGQLCPSSQHGPRHPPWQATLHCAGSCGCGWAPPPSHARSLSRWDTAHIHACSSGQHTESIQAGGSHWGPASAHNLFLLTRGLAGVSWPGSPLPAWVFHTLSDMPWVQVEQ